jgi:hypothetical protein
VAIARTTAQDATGSTSATYPSTASAGDLLICAAAMWQTTNAASLAGWGSSIATVPAGPGSGSCATLQVWAKNSAGTEKVVTPSAGSGTTIFGVSLCEYTGVGNPYAFDGTLVTTGPAGANESSQVTGSLTTTNPGSLIFEVAATSDNNVTSPAWVTATLFDNNLAGGYRFWLGQYLPGATESGYSDTASWSSSTAYCATLLCAFKPAAAADLLAFF